MATPTTSDIIEIGELAGASLAHTAKCASQHFAPWMIEEQWFRAAIEAVKTGTLKPKAGAEDNADGPEALLYTVHSGVAVIPLAGPLMKKASKYGGTSTVATRQAIRKALHDDTVSSILLHIDSPGGTVAGTADLASDVRVADSVKPVYAHIDDLGASAAYWVASQSRRITANATARVGSIGTLLVLDDTSGMYAAKGIKVHVISTGKYKGAGAEGAPITPEQIAMFQEEVDDLNEHFLIGVQKGRKISMAQVREIADGRVHIASKAKDLGLIDEVGSVETAVAAILKDERTRVESATNQSSSSAEVPATALNEPESVTGISPPTVSPSGEPAQPQSEKPMTEVIAPVAPAAPVAAVAPTAPNLNTVEGLSQVTADNHFNRGVTAGKQAERVAQQDLLRHLVAAAPGKLDIAVNAFLTGQSPESVKLAFDAANAVEQHANARIAAIQLENARQLALASAGGYSNGVATGVKNDEPSMAFAPDTPPDVQAKMEWDGNYNNCRNTGATEKQYLLSRVQALSGNVRAFSAKK